MQVTRSLKSQHPSFHRADLYLSELSCECALQRLPDTVEIFKKTVSTEGRRHTENSMVLEEVYSDSSFDVYRVYAYSPLGRQTGALLVVLLKLENHSLLDI